MKIVETLLYRKGDKNALHIVCFKYHIYITNTSIKMLSIIPHVGLKHKIQKAALNNYLFGKKEY